MLAFLCMVHGAAGVDFGPGWGRMIQTSTPLLQRATCSIRSCNMEQLCPLLGRSKHETMPLVHTHLRAAPGGARHTAAAAPRSRKDPRLQM